MAHPREIPVGVVTLADAARQLGYTYVGLQSRSRTDQHFPCVFKMGTMNVIDKAEFEIFAANCAPRKSTRVAGSTTDRLAKIEAMLLEVCARMEFNGSARME